MCTEDVLLKWRRHAEEWLLWVGRSITVILFLSKLDRRKGQQTFSQPMGSAKSGLRPMLSREIKL